MSQTHASESPPRKRHAWLVLIVAALIVLAAIPWILAKTTLRDRLLNAIVGSEEISVTSTNASFGYLSPLSLSGLQIRSKNDSTQIEVKTIQSDHSWLGLLLSRPELGVFRFDDPKINVLVDPEQLKAAAALRAAQDPKPPSSTVALPILSAEINNAVIMVRTPTSPEPPIDLQHIQLTVRLDRNANGSVLRIEPATVFDHQRLTPQLCGQGLQLIVPLLADEVDAEGEFSLRLEHFEIPIGAAQTEQDKSIHIEGELQLHQANVGLRNTIAKGISDLLLKLVGIDAPNRLTVAKDLIVRFQVIDGRVQHEGLALLLPHGESSVEFMSSGSVGLDESLDLKVAVKLPDELLGGNALAQRLTKDPIVLAITGTLDQPKVELASSGGLVKSIQGLIKGDVSDEEAEESVNEVVSGAVDVVGGLLEGLRQRAAERAEQRAAEGAAEGAEQRAASGEDRPLLPNLRERLRDNPLLRNRRGANDEPAPPAPPEPIDL